jgi:hypothetical protein
MNVRAVLVLVLLASTAGPVFAGGPWYVDANAMPSGDGSQQSPFATIGEGIAAASLRDTVLVLPGTYTETVSIVRDVTVRSTGGPLVTIIEAVPGSAAAVTMHPTECRLEGFTVRRSAAGPDEAGIRIEPTTDAYVVRCLLRGHDVAIRNEYDAFVQESTITQNRLGIFGPFDALDVITDSVLHGNAEWDLQNVAGVSYLSYSDVGTRTGVLGDTTGTFDADPMFWDAAGEDFHLRADSPCIDTGDPAEPLDPDGSRIDVGALTFDPAWAPGTARFCFGDAATCPCGNGGSGLGGCDIAQSTGGIELSVQDFLPDGAGGGTVELVGAGYPPASTPGVTLIRSPAPETPPVVFGDGLRCIAAAGLVRINATLAAGGVSLNPAMHGAGAGTFHYQVWVRNQPAMFCTPEAFNLSNGVSITW